MRQLVAHKRLKTMENYDTIRTKRDQSRVWEVIVHERFLSLSIDGEKSFLGRWSLLMGGGRSPEVLIIEHWLEKNVLSVGGRILWEGVVYKRF